MDKSELMNIVSALIKRLQDAPDGYAIATAQLLHVAGYRTEDFTERELFEIHYALFAAAEEIGLVLDMSSHDNRFEGLPFNLDFVLRK